MQRMIGLLILADGGAGDKYWRERPKVGGKAELLKKKKILWSESF